jgi:hypothetical protein
MQVKTNTLNGNVIAYSDLTEFLIQTRKGKSAYRTQYRFTGDLAKAVFYYNAINIGNGYRKRLYAPTMNKPTLARQFS